MCINIHTNTRLMAHSQTTHTHTHTPFVPLRGVPAHISSDATKPTNPVDPVTRADGCALPLCLATKVPSWFKRCEGYADCGVPNTTRDTLPLANASIMTHIPTLCAVLPSLSPPSPEATNF